jgi:hypothetical protein
MKKISITFNGYEYKYLRYARDILNRNELRNASIKDVLFSFLSYTKAKIQEGSHVNRFLNIFLIKNNAKLLQEIEEMTPRKNANNVFLISNSQSQPFSFNSILYVLRLSDEDIQLLNGLLNIIHCNTHLNPNYSEIIRNSIHFIIDNYNLKKEFYSILYLLKYSIFDSVDIPIIMNFLISNKKSEYKKYAEKIKHEQSLITNKTTLNKLKAWITQTKLDEDEKTYLKIEKDIGMYYDGTFATGSFIDFVLFLNNLYYDLTYDYILNAHYSFQETVSNVLDDAKNLYISNLEQIFKIENEIINQ